MKWLALAFGLLACNGPAPEPSPSCPAIDASACQQPVPSYAKDVVPVLDRTCNSTCHAPGVGPWPLNNHQDVVDWGSIIAGDIEQCSMPPPDASAGNGVMTDSERALVLDWFACGAPDN